MDDRATPDEKLHMGRCREMGFAQLRRHIHDTVERLSNPSFSPNEEYPRSHEELLMLCDMLKEKVDALKDDVPTPERPTYDGPPRPGYSFTPSDELEDLYRQQRRAERRVEYEGRHGDGGVYLEYIQGELEEVERKVAPLEQSEIQQFNERVREYREAHDPYLQRLGLWRKAVERINRRREAEANREKMVHHAYQKVRRAFGSERTLRDSFKGIGTVTFEIAPPGESTDDRAIYRYFSGIVSRGELPGFDQERLDKLLALPRSGWLKGTAGLEGYIVLKFAHTVKVLMDCPVYGNALYILDSDEERLLWMKKPQLIASDETKRIFHSGDWYRRVKRELGIE